MAFRDLAEVLAALRCTNAVEANDARSLVGRENPERVSVSDRDDFAAKIKRSRSRLDDERGEQERQAEQPERLFHIGMSGESLHQTRSCTRCWHR